MVDVDSKAKTLAKKRGGKADVEPGDGETSEKNDQSMRESSSKEIQVRVIRGGKVGVRKMEKKGGEWGLSDGRSQP